MPVRYSLRAVLAMAAVLLLGAVPAFADSQARIVRLSDVQGDVQIQRQSDARAGGGAAQGADPVWERAVLNMPLTQGMSVRTVGEGRAEVEFENGSVVRLAADSQVEFPQLSLSSAGEKLSTVQLDQGTIYGNVQHQGDAAFKLVLGPQQIPVTHDARFRIAMGSDQARIAVYHGELAFKKGGEEARIKKGEELSLNLSAGTAALANNIEPGQSDGWDKQRNDYHDRYYAQSAYDTYPYYGRGDLAFYGGWYDVAGYGTLWQPWNVGFGWDPFAMGSWGWYPGLGYMYMSGYPWGWLPYRYGSWQYVPGWGWGWMPGSYFGPVATMPRVVHPPAGFVVPQPPAGSGVRPPGSHVAPVPVVRPPGQTASETVAGHPATAVHAMKVKATAPPRVAFAPSGTGSNTGRYSGTTAGASNSGAASHSGGVSHASGGAGHAGGGASGHH
jgi:hypothetical protein